MQKIRLGLGRLSHPGFAAKQKYRKNAISICHCDDGGGPMSSARRKNALGDLEAL